MNTAIEVENYALKIDLHEIFRAMSAEDQNSFIHALALQSNIIDKVVNYICGEDEFGSWTSAEPELRQKILERVEAKHVSDLGRIGPRYGWRQWSAIEDALKKIRCKQQVYWALHHDKHLNDKYGWELVSDFFKRHGIESDYTTKQADADIAEIKKMIQDAFRSTPNRGTQEEEKWIRARFNANYDDSRPVKWPPPGPFWESGFAADESYSVVVAYVKEESQIAEFWPEANKITTEENVALVFTDRFPEPDWWSALKSPGRKLMEGK